MNIATNQTKLKTEIKKKADKYSKYYTQSNSISQTSNLPLAIKNSSSFAFGKKTFKPKYLTISNFASLTIHLFWKDGLINIYQVSKNNYASEEIISLVTINSAKDIDTWIKEIKYFIMQKCGWSSQSYRQFVASVYKTILEELEKRDALLSQTGDHLALKDFIEYNPKLTKSKTLVSKKTKDVDFLEMDEFQNKYEQSQIIDDHLVFMHKADLLGGASVGFLLDWNGAVLKANIKDPMNLIQNKCISDTGLLESCKKHVSAIIDVISHNQTKSLAS